jgi:hypothetical protein
MIFKNLLKQINDISAQIAQKIESSVAELSQKVSVAQQELYNTLIETLLTELDFKDGKLDLSQKNMERLASIDTILDGFRRDVLDTLLSDYSKELIKMRDLSADYFKQTGWEKDVVNKLQNDMSFIEARLGINVKGAFVVGGYLDTLAQTPQLRQDLKNVLVQAMSANRSLKNFKNGLNEVVKGSTGKDGMLDAYFHRYAYDSYNQIFEMSNKHFADGLGLKWFIYQGSIIKTTRTFCRKKVGKVFSTDEVEKWRNDSDLIEKSTKASYNPLLERGRYNCRHFIAYISEALAKKLAPDKFGILPIKDQEKWL